MPFNPSSSLARLLDAPMRSGRLVWIGLRTERRGPVASVECAELIAGRGLQGDRYNRVDGVRQITLIGQENLAAIAAFLGREAIAAEDLRRNLVVEGINLLGLKARAVRIGEAILDISGECHPCSRMEEVLGAGGYNAMRGQGGVTARVRVGGVIRIGEAIARLDGPSPLLDRDTADVTGS